MKRIDIKSPLFGIVLFFIFLSLSCTNSSKETVWPPDLPTADKNGIATLSGVELLQMPSVTKSILDSYPELQLSVAKNAPKVELQYFDELPSINLAATGWSSWGDICLASDGKVYAGIGNHAGIVNGETLIYCYNPSTKKLEKIVDINKITDANPNEVHFSKVHASIIEGKDKKIYFIATLDDGAKAGRSPILEKWNDKIPAGKIFQYDPETGKTIMFADLPKARVTAVSILDINRNMLYCALEGDPDGTALGVFDMDDKKWIYEGTPGQVKSGRCFMLDSNGNVYFNGLESAIHKKLRLENEEDEPNHLKKGKRSKNMGIYTTLWKYNPRTNSVTSTNSYLKSHGIRSATNESKNGYIYGTTWGGELFRYSPSKDEMILLGSNFLRDGEYITVCELSADERYLYYLPGAHGSAGLSGTPIIQYNIEKEEQKALAFLFEPMNKIFNYSPGGTYGIKLSDDGSTFYVSFNGSPIESLRTKGSARGFGLCSFAVIQIPTEEIK